MRALVLSILFFSLSLLLVEKTASASCGTILEGTQWSSRDDVKQVLLPLEELMFNGVAHLPLQNEWIRFFSTRRSSETIDDQNRMTNQTYEEISWWIMSSILDHFPRVDLQHVSYGQQGFSIEPRTVFLDPNQVTKDFHWHADVHQGKLDPKEVLEFQEKKLKKFTVRATLLAPLDLYPTTVIRPINGSFKGQSIQGPAGTLTLMILEVTEHSGDFRYITNGRGLFGWDFKVSTEGNGRTSSDFFRKPPSKK